MILPRRQFLTGIGLLLAAPAIVRASNIMPVRSVPGLIPVVGHPDWQMIPVIAGQVLGVHGGQCYNVIRTGMVRIDRLDASPLLRRIGRTVGIPEWG